MESDSWCRLSAAALRRLQSHYGSTDLFVGHDEAEEADATHGTTAAAAAMEYICPFCNEEFDIVGLCCHIDYDHAVEAKNGVCPICAGWIGTDLVGHLSMQHPSYFKVPRKSRFRKVSTGSHSLLTLLRKDLRDGTLQSLIRGASHVAAPAAAPDPFLSSLMYTLPTRDPKKGSGSSVNDFWADKNKTEEKVVQRVESSMSKKDQKEMAQRSKFVRDLLQSAIFDDDL